MNSTYSNWSKLWDEQKPYVGTKMPEADIPKRIAGVLGVWRLELPDNWLRRDWSYIKAEGYRRGDRTNPGPEHSLEVKLFAKNEWEMVGAADTTARFIPVLNAVSLANENSKQRESDVLGFLAVARGKIPCVVEMKGEVTNSAWFAVVELLQHIRMLHHHPAGFLPPEKPFDRIHDLPLTEMVGMVLAPRSFFNHRGQKENSFLHARMLIDQIAQETGVTVLMAALEDDRIELLYGNL